MLWFCSSERVPRDTTQKATWEFYYRACVFLLFLLPRLNRISINFTGTGGQRAGREGTSSKVHEWPNTCPKPFFCTTHKQKPFFCWLLFPPGSLYRCTAKLHCNSAKCNEKSANCFFVCVICRRIFAPNPNPSPPPGTAHCYGCCHWRIYSRHEVTSSPGLLCLFHPPQEVTPACYADDAHSHIARQQPKPKPTLDATTRWQLYDIRARLGRFSVLDFSQNAAHIEHNRKRKKAHTGH